MGSRITIAYSIILIILIAACVGLAVWSSNLAGQISTLSDDTEAFMADTAVQFGNANDSIAGVGSDLTAFKSETSNEFSGVQTDISGLDSALAAFSTDTNTSISTINSNLTDITTYLSESTMNVRQIYDNVIDGVVRIMGDIGNGSGFIYRSDGYVITCQHVIDGQTSINVVLHDGSFAPATVVGSDEVSDIAVLRLVGKTGLPSLPLADSGALVPGEPVIVVGSPESVFETVTYGVISRTSYADMGVGPGGLLMHSNLIQYDAPSNHGNSGGPVFNRDGQVIGIVSWGKIAPINDMNYAVSSNKIRKVADSIIDSGSYTHAFLPVMWWSVDMTPERAIDMGLDSAFGVLFTVAIDVGEVHVADVAIAVDGIMIRDMADLASYIAEFKSVGDTITLTVIRDGTEVEASVTLVASWLGLNIYPDIEGVWTGYYL